MVCLAFTPAGAGQKRRVNADAATIADFMARIKGYVALHDKLDATLQEVPDRGTTEQFFEHQRALGRLIQRERSSAKPGDLCTKEMRSVIRRLLGVVFRGPGGRQIKRSILDENTAIVRLEINGRYPDGLPVSTVPPQVLKELPTLPDVLEYRFVGQRLILLDAHAHIVIDWIDRVFP